MTAPVHSWVTSVPPAPSRRTPTPPVAPTAPSSDPDAPLNLSKPKSSPRLPSHVDHSPHLQDSQLGPLAATAPKLLPPSLVMQRAFLPYAGLPPHVNPSGKFLSWFV